MEARPLTSHGILQPIQLFVEVRLADGSANDAFGHRPAQLTTLLASNRRQSFLGGVAPAAPEQQEHQDDEGDA